MFGFDCAFSFGVRFGPEAGVTEPSCSHQLAVSRASFSGSSTLVIARGILVYLVDCEAQQVRLRACLHCSIGLKVLISLTPRGASAATPALLLVALHAGNSPD